MADPAEPLILGYDSENKRWSEGEVTARVRSLSEPDRAVPLTARLEVVPDILDYTLDCSQKELFRASLRLRPEAQLPADDRARLTIIADPMLEAALQVLGLAGGLPVPAPFKNLRAQVQVVLVPYCLRVSLAGNEIGAQLDLEADGKSAVVLEIGVHKVDGGGRLSDRPAALAVELGGSVEGLKLEQQPRPEGGMGLRILADKPLLTGRTAALTFSSTLPSGRVLRRELNLQLKPLAAELQMTPAGDYQLGGEHPPEFLLSVRNSTGKPVSGLATHWSLYPAVGSLSVLEGVTDANGQVRVSYRPPTREQAEAAFQGETLALQVQVSAGPDRQVLSTRQWLLRYLAILAVRVEKAGFATLNQRLELRRPGGVRLQIRTADGRKDPVVLATVKAEGRAVFSDRQGVAVLGEAVTNLELALQLDVQSQELCNLIVKELAELQKADWLTGMLSRVCQRVDAFLTQDYVSRLAAEDPEEYEDSFLNLKALHPVIRVGLLSVQLFERRFGRFREQFSSALGNLAGAFYTWMGDKYFPRIGSWLGDKVTRLLRYLAGKLSGRAWILGRARGAVTTLRNGLGRLTEKLRELRSKVGSQRQQLPESLDQKLNQSFEILPPPGHIAPGEEAARLVEEAAQKAGGARKLWTESSQILQLVEREAAELQAALARAEAAATPNPAELSQLRQQVQSAGQRLQRARESARQAQQALEQAEAAEQTARTGFADLQEMCSALNELVSTFLQALSQIYEYGAWLLAYLVVQIGAALLTNMRTVLGGVHPDAPENLNRAVDDLVRKQAFTTAFELGGYYLVGPAIHQALLLYQSYALSVALEEALEISGRWQKLDPEGMKSAIRWWYEDIDAASFKAEESEIWVELGAELVDWLECLLVWVTRLVNLLLGVVGALVSLLTLGAGLPAWLLISGGFTAFIEGMDAYWDIVKAVARSGGALMGATEVWGVVLPAHGSFTARLYGDPDLQRRLDRAWTYPIDAELRQKLAGLASHKVTFPGETALEAVNQKLEELGAQVGL